MSHDARHTSCTADPTMELLRMNWLAKDWRLSRVASIRITMATTCFYMVRGDPNPETIPACTCQYRQYTLIWVKLGAKLTCYVCLHPKCNPIPLS